MRCYTCKTFQTLMRQQKREKSTNENLNFGNILEFFYNFQFFSISSFLLSEKVMKGFACITTHQILCFEYERKENKISRITKNVALTRPRAQSCAMQNLDEFDFQCNFDLFWILIQGLVGRGLSARAGARMFFSDKCIVIFDLL